MDGVALCSRVQSVNKQPCINCVLCTFALMRCDHTCAIKQVINVPLCAAMVGIWIGTMLYNVSCFTPAVLCTLPVPLPANVHAFLLKWAVAIPNVVAGCLFVSGSFTCWAAAAKTCRLSLLLQGRTLSGGHWGFLLYLLVSCSCLRLSKSSDQLPHS